MSSSIFRVSMGEFERISSKFSNFSVNFFPRITDEGEGTTFDSNSSSTIKLNNGTVLYLREVNKFLALVCILREDNFDKQGKYLDFLIKLILLIFFKLQD